MEVSRCNSNRNSFNGREILVVTEIVAMVCNCRSCNISGNSSHLNSCKY